MSAISIFNLPQKIRLIIKLNIFSIKGYLNDSGWVKSFLLRLPYDKWGEPLPWVTYPYIDFIKDRLNKNMSIFEYGSGNSTLFYSSKVKSVTTVEHDTAWFRKFSQDLPENVYLIYQELQYNSQYSRSSSQQKKFDLIIVDGRDRVNCIKNSVDAIATDGVIVLDDSEREEYKEGCDFLSNQQFKRLDFWGIAPGLFYKKCTTIFYKENNILNI